MNNREASGRLSSNAPRNESITGGENRGVNSKSNANNYSSAPGCNLETPNPDSLNRGGFGVANRSFSRGGNRARGGFSRGRGRGTLATSMTSGDDNSSQTYVGEVGNSKDESYARRMKERYGTHNKRFMADRKRRG